MWDNVKDFVVPMLTRLVIKLASGGLLTLGITASDVFMGDLANIVTGILLAIIGALMSKKNTDKALAADPKAAIPK